LQSRNQRSRTHAVVHPFIPTHKRPAHERAKLITVYAYDAESIITQHNDTIESLEQPDTSAVNWVNIDGFNEKDIEVLSNQYAIHLLVQEDILSYGQRPKVDEIENTLSVLMYMLYYNTQTNTIEQEQVSILLVGKKVISFQEDASRDVFDPIREKLKLKNSKLRQRGADYLFYSLIDIIVDSYFIVIEHLGNQIELTEEDLLQKASPESFTRINQLRKEIILLKRNVSPVRDMIAAILRNDSENLDDRTTKYFKDVYDHIIQANDLIENYRDLVMSLQDLYLNNLNLRMNEVMKTLTILTTVMAPATVIGGIFGMNFDVIPFAHNHWGFYGTIITMLIIPVFMIYWFKNRGWFTSDWEQFTPSSKDTATQ